MSQSGALSSSGSGGGSPVETLTGNTGGPVGPDAAFNINILANTVMGITTIGNPGTNTINILGIQSTTSQFGVVKLATSAQAIAGTDTANAVTSAALGAKLGVQTANGIPYGNGTSSAIGWTSALTNGQLLIGSTGLAPVAAGLTAGSGISIATGAGSITISASGTSTLTYTAVNNAMSPYTVVASDEYLGVTTTGGAVTIRLPNAPSTGRTFIIKDTAGTSLANNVTVTTVGGAVNIDGATSYVINSAYQSIEVIFNGSAYEIF